VITAEEPPTVTFEKLDLNLFSAFGTKIYKTKPALPNNFSLGPKRFWDIFNKFVIPKCFCELGRTNATKTLALEKLDFKLFSDFGKKISIENSALLYNTNWWPFPWLSWG
jgi:hypothetical protein